MNKKCPNCNKIKLLKFFSSSKNRPDKVSSVCKKCFSHRNKEYRKTLPELISVIYNHQKQRSKEKGYNPPSYNKKQLREWITSQVNFNTLFNQWKNQDFSSDYSPSIYRLDDYKGYSFDNIRVCTWKENLTKHHNDRKQGINNKISKAGRILNVSHSSIRKCCKGELKTVKGYNWKLV